MKNSTCTYGTLKISGVTLDKENPYPDLTYLNTKEYRAAKEIEGELYLGYGQVNTVLPYSMQDCYGRERKQIELKTVVLENEFIKAVFLPECGARLWSLYDKKHGRELLHANTIFQPTNIAVRNAWVAGGVEWNIGFRGHTAFTSDKVFCEEGYDEKLDIPIIRFYEYERIRNVVFEVCAYLPENSDRLHVKITIQNCNDEEIPMYWWSNIAVPETIDTRIIVPSTEAYTNNYSGEIAKTPVPYSNRTDVTYTATQQRAKDYFFYIKPEDAKFIAAVDKNGFGLLHTSTSRLISRKLFLWGMQSCYRNWQNLLSEPANPYLEIQAGLCHTQMECMPMPAKEKWEWLESYGPIEIDGAKAHSASWSEVVTAASEYLAKAEPIKELEEELIRSKSFIFNKDCKSIKYYGSGWGAIENALRSAEGKNQLSENVDFPIKAVSESENIWLDLLNKNTFLCPEDDRVPVSFMKDERWLRLLEEYLKTNQENWFGWYTLAIGRFAMSKPNDALTCMKKASELKENAHTLYGMAMLTERVDKEAAVEYMKKAYLMKTDDYCMAKAVFNMLLRNDRAAEITELWEKLSPELKKNGRMIYFKLEGCIAQKDIEGCNEILKNEFLVHDIREGEKSLRNVWNKYAELIMEEKGISAEERKEYAEKFLEIPHWLDY